MDKCIKNGLRYENICLFFCCILLIFLGISTLYKLKKTFSSKNCIKKKFFSCPHYNRLLFFTEAVMMRDRK